MGKPNGLIVFYSHPFSKRKDPKTKCLAILGLMITKIKIDIGSQFETFNGMMKMEE